MPAASDPAIFDRILDRLEPYRECVMASLSNLNDAAQKAGSEDFLSLAKEKQLTICNTALGNEFKNIFQMQVVTTYYTDDRAMIGVGMPPRPAFPEGYQLKETDWSLVDPVRARGVIYRKAPE